MPMQTPPQSHGISGHFTLMASVEIPDVQIDNIFPSQWHPRYESAEGKDAVLDLRITVNRRELGAGSAIQKIIDALHALGFNMTN